MRGEASRVLEPAPTLVLAMALHQNGQVEEARETLAAAIRAHDWSAERVRSQHDWIYHVLRREAEHLVQSDLPDLRERP
jgi:serine/threonine-protein kinase